MSCHMLSNTRLLQSVSSLHFSLHIFHGFWLCLDILNVHSSRLKEHGVESWEPASWPRQCPVKRRFAIDIVRPRTLPAPPDLGGNGNKIELLPLSIMTWSNEIPPKELLVSGMKKGFCLLHAATASTPCGNQLRLASCVGAADEDNLVSVHRFLVSDISAATTIVYVQCTVSKARPPEIEVNRCDCGRFL